MKSSALILIRHTILALFLLFGLGGCVGAIVGTVVDVGIEVVKIPFKLGKAVYDVTKSDDDKKTDQTDTQK